MTVNFFGSEDMHEELEIRRLMAEAIERDDATQVKNVLAMKFKDDNGQPRTISPNAPIRNTHSLLHFCAISNRPRSAEALIANGASIHNCDNAGAKPLHTTARYGSTAVADILLKAGADINATMADGLTPLHRAVACNQPTTAEFLLKNGARADIADKNGKTAAMTAAEKKYSHFTSLLKTQTDILHKNRLEALDQLASRRTRAAGKTETAETDEAWEKINPHAVAQMQHVSMAGLTLIHIFDFAARERQILSKFDSGQAASETRGFDLIHEKAPIEKALEKLKELGGDADPDSVRCTPRRMEKLPGKTP